MVTFRKRDNTTTYNLTEKIYPESAQMSGFSFHGMQKTEDHDELNHKARARETLEVAQVLQLIHCGDSKNVVQTKL